MTISSILPNDFNFSVCIDECDDSIESSIKSIKKKQINSMSILNINGKYISDLPDDTLLKIRSMLSGTSVHAIKIDIGFKSIPTEINIDKQLSVAKFFGAKQQLRTCLCFQFFQILIFPCLLMLFLVLFQ